MPDLHCPCPTTSAPFAFGHVSHRSPEAFVPADMDPGTLGKTRGASPLVCGLGELGVPEGSLWSLSTCGTTSFVS